MTVKQAIVGAYALLGFAAGAADTVLPKEYVEVEFIESTADGKECLDTGYCPSTSTRIVADMMPFEKTGDWPVFFGVTGNNSPSDGVLLRYYNTAVAGVTGVNAWFCATNALETWRPGFVNTRFTAELKAGEVKVGDWTGAITTTGTPYNGPIYIFCGNNGGKAWRHQAMRLYSFKIYEGETLKRDFVPCVRVRDGNDGLYDRVQGEFRPMVRAADKTDVELVEDRETLNGPYAAAGQVLKHNHRYFVTEDTTIDASAMPGVSAVRVPIGAAVIIDIAAGKTLTLTGGPGYGRIPGGAGIEVPRGSKLVVKGGEGSHLNVTGGNAASGGRGYGGMGGQFAYIQMTKDMDPAHHPYAHMPEGQGDVTNNNIAASEIFKDPLYFGRTGDGGDGGDGGGGAGAGIGTRGGVGGLGGVGAAGKFVIGGDYYTGSENRYADFSTFFGIDKVRDWYFYGDGEDGKVRWDGLNGGAGGDGGAALSCGEIIVIGDVTVSASSGAEGLGGENGPFGSTAQAYDKSVKGLDPSEVDQELSVTSTVVGGVATVMGLFERLAPLSFLGGSVSALFSIVSMINDAVNDDKSTLKKQLWFVGGGGGGGGGSGAAGVGIGAGGAGGGGAGAGGGGFFEMGAYTVYKMKNGFIGKNIDATTPPYQLSGHGGAGGRGAKDGWPAISLCRGQAEEHRKGDGESADRYNCLPFHNDTADWRLGASSWLAGARAWGGKGGSGGASGAANRDRFEFFCCDQKKIAGLSDAAQTTKLSQKDRIFFNVEYYRGETENEQSMCSGSFICGTLVERAPLVDRPDYFFNGYWTTRDGNNDGVLYFDRFGNSSGFPKVDGDLKLYARWTKTKGSEGFTKIVDGTSLSDGALLEDRTIYRFATDATFKGATGRPGLVVATGATAVIYLDKPVRVSCTGADGAGATPGYPGIEVPSGSTLIVTGEGTLVANGGAGGAGSAGGAGGNGVIYTDSSDYKDSDYDNVSYSEEWDNHGQSGAGGAGGAGGGGAAPGLGGRGGFGADKQSFSHDWGSEYRECSASGDYFRKGEVYPGEKGNAGGVGGDAGTIYLLGGVTVEVKSGAAAAGQAAGGAAGGQARYKWTNWYNAGGGGGGGGGGNGCLPSAAIGGGGGGGGSGGTGGGGGLMIWSTKDNSPNGVGGTGGFGSADGLRGKSGEPTSVSSGYWGDSSGGAGGAGGSKGANGANGGLYINEAVKLTGVKLSGGGLKVEYAFGHSALERTLTFHLSKTATTPETNITVATQIGMPLPVLPDSCVRPKPGSVLAGAYRVANGVTNWWYKAKGEPAIPQYEGLEDVTLDVVYMLDTERMADVPRLVNFPYDGSNKVAFVARENPGCGCFTGRTNATETGAYSYSVRLNDGYTVWSDLVTDRVRTIPWEITRAAITNEWVSNAVTYDWTKSHAANWFAVTNDPARTLGFGLPPDAHVTFELGERVQVNVQRLIVTIDGMANYLDKRYYGTYSCAQPFQLNLRPHYPWAAKLDITCSASSFKLKEEEEDAFKETYGRCPIVAEVHVPDATGGVRVVTLNAGNAYTVRDAMSSGSRSKIVTVDLKGVAGLENMRAYALPVYVSLDGQVFQGGTTTVDTMAGEKDGWPLHTVHDVNDIFDIACSVSFVEEGGTVMYDEGGKIHSVLAIGSWAQSGERFVPQTVSGNVMVDDFVRWTPTLAGEYMLEHWVANPYAPNGVTGYRRAYFSFRGEGGTEPKTERNPLVRVKVTRASTGETVGYTSLAAAVAELRYGDELAVVRDVQMENAKIPVGSTVRVEDDGVFRVSVDRDNRASYVTTVVCEDANGKVTNVTYSLNEEMAQARICGGDPFGLSEDGRAFRFAVDNVKPDLYYLVRWSDDIRTWTTAAKVFADGREGTMPLEVPASGTKGFYAVATTADPGPVFEIGDDGAGKVRISGSTALAAGIFSGRLVIPREVAGKAVSGVAAGAFAHRADILSLDVSSGVESLGANAFSSCSRLASVSLAEGLLEIADGAFDGAALAELVVPASVRAVGALDLTELKTLRFLGKPDSIGDIRLSPDCIVYVPQDAGWTAVPSANWHGTQLEYWVDFARTVANGEATITGCATIPPDRRLRIPETLDGVPVTAIGAEAFYGCDGLTAVEFPASLVSLGRGVFGDAGKPSGITSLTFNGDAPDYDAEIGLDPSKCTIHVRVGASGWGETWQGCPVIVEEVRGPRGDSP